MIKLEHTEVYGWEAAIRGMRNPLNSWDKSDSAFRMNRHMALEIDFIGANDLKLMKQLSKAGSDHGKFLRYINVTVDITAPLYWWKEYDTYKVGTVANSCSTMHKIQAKEFTHDDFSREHLTDGSMDVLSDIIYNLNYYREQFLKTKVKAYWWQMIQLLPTSYNQKRTVQLNYQVLKTMYHARKNHKLNEWHDFCDWCESLPYFKNICLS